MPKNLSKNIRTVLAILKDETEGNVQNALKKITNDYRMTWAYLGRGGKLFPTTKKDIRKELEEVYPIKGRKYDIRNVAEGNNVVIVEMTESYPDPKIKKLYRTPLVIVLEMKNGKIRRGRHYCDPRLSYVNLTKRHMKKLFG